MNKKAKSSRSLLPEQTRMWSPRGNSTFCLMAELWETQDATEAPETAPLLYQRQTGKTRSDSLLNNSLWSRQRKGDEMFFQTTNELKLQYKHFTCLGFLYLIWAIKQRGKDLQRTSSRSMSSRAIPSLWQTSSMIWSHWPTGQMNIRRLLRHFIIYVERLNDDFYRN